MKIMKLRQLMRATTYLKVVSIAIAIVMWWIVSLFYPPSIIPSPAITFATLWTNAVTGVCSDVLWFHVCYGVLWFHTAVTIERVFFGFAIALLSGVLVGVAMGVSRKVENLLNFIVLILLSIPGPAMAIIALMWFGLNQWATIAVSYGIVFPLIVINVVEGMKNIDADLVQMAQSYNADRQTILFSLIIPSISAYIYSASRFSLGVALKVAVIAELFGVTSGIGYELQYYYSLFRMDEVFAWTAMFAILILLFDIVIFKFIESYFFSWRRSIAR